MTDEKPRLAIVVRYAGRHVNGETYEAHERAVEWDREKFPTLEALVRHLLEADRPGGLFYGDPVSVCDSIEIRKAWFP